MEMIYFYGIYVNVRIAKKVRSVSILLLFFRFSRTVEVICFSLRYSNNPGHLPFMYSILPTWQSVGSGILEGEACAYSLCFHTAASAFFSFEMGSTRVCLLRCLSPQSECLR